MQDSYSSKINDVFSNELNIYSHESGENNAISSEPFFEKSFLIDFAEDEEEKLDSVDVAVP